MARCTKEEALETRSRILNAAEEVFYTRGLAQSSLADVAVAAEVTRGAIYWHFKNKSDLFDAMCERVRLPMESLMTVPDEKFVGDPLGHLRNVWGHLLKDAATNPRSHKVLDIMFLKCELVDRSDPIWMRQHECYLKGLANMERILQEAIELGHLPADLDTRLAALTLHGHVIGLLLNWLFSPTTFDLAAVADPLIDACLDSLRYAPSLRLKKAD
ncbi:TetR family transcriptional regulator [Herminiimonas sp.]|uniref:TetR family transcriptional regulator n=1 Tax=Herminiimonas sp. TaxID=1926289 RepID=UPI00271F4CDB|nr:TetR family transcriptional regulator [Herminiimonas sp.]MDO8304797.1 TetR family transcriptional regulator [Herminiimonas sp.]